MTVHHDIDSVLLQDTQIDCGAQGFGRAKEDVLKVSSEHRAAPAVRQRSAQSLHEDVPVIRVNSHGAAVHDLDDLPVDSARADLELAPELLAPGGGSGNVLELAFLLTKHVESALSQGLGDLRVTVPIGGNSEFGRHAAQLYGILNGIAAFSLRGQKKRMGYIASVIGVGGRSTRNHADQVAGHNRIRIRSTSASARLTAEGIDAAGSHITDSTTNAELTKAALRLLLVPTVPSRLESLLVGMLEHFLCSTINALLIHRSLAFSRLSLQRRVLEENIHHRAHRDHREKYVYSCERALKVTLACLFHHSAFSVPSVSSVVKPFLRLMPPQPQCLSLLAGDKLSSKHRCKSPCRAGVQPWPPPPVVPRRRHPGSPHPRPSPLP